MKPRSSGVLLSLSLSLALVALAACSSSSGSSCPGGSLSCGGACVDPTLDTRNCGFCGNSCAAGLSCASGICALACPAGQVACGGACINPQTDATWCGASGSCSGAQAGASCTTGQACTAGACACVQEALDLDTPLAIDLPAWIRSVAGQQAPTAFYGALPAPRPTNMAWQQLVVGSGQGRADFLPYQVKALPEGLAVANAAPVASATDVTVPDLKQIVVAAYPGSFTGRAVIAYDLLSVTMQYTMPGGTMTAPLVQGSPYVTVDYAGLMPFLTPGADFTTTRSIVSVNLSTSPGAVTGTRFQLLLSDGTIWVVYASASVTFNWTPGNMAATAPFTGTLRLANAPGAAAMAALDTHAAVVPLRGRLGVSISCDVATLSFSYTTRGSGTLLMAALPHHLSRMAAPTTTALTFSTLSGPLTGVKGSTWTMSLPLSTIGWTAPRAMAPAHVEAVRTALATDSAYRPDAAAVDADPYFGGKYMAKLARLALIADELGETATALALRDRLRPMVAAWLDGTNGNPLVYDTTWGGVVTTRSLASPGADFGQGHYNDHHFHYGYHLYAAAALARAEPAFFAAHRAGLLALVRDIANPSGADPRFPRFRHMDFFRGHSWATGLTEYPDLPDQESTSEAVNAWYGLVLLGQASGETRAGQVGRRMVDVGRVLLALELDAARTYWQIPLASTIYPASFAQNRCVGRLFATRASFGTWFSDGTGTDLFKIYGIQMLPFTPVSEDLISPTWVADAWASRMQPAADSASGAWAGWKGLLYMAHAAIGREAAWSEVFPLGSVEDGNSQTNTLWWVASRP